MDLFLKITAAVVLGMMLVSFWPAYKHWQQQDHKAQKGDWPAAILALGAVVLFVILLVSLV